MKRLFFLILFFLQSCVLNGEKESFDLDFSDNMTFQEFQIKLDEYAKNSQYPDLNNLNE